MDNVCSSFFFCISHCRAVERYGLDVDFDLRQFCIICGDYPLNSVWNTPEVNTMPFLKLNAKFIKRDKSSLTTFFND